MPNYQNILMVYPEVPNNTYWSFKYALKFIRKKSAMPPLGLLTVAALFPPDYDLKLVDMNIEPLPDEAIEWADAVFISAMIVQQDSVESVIARCNRMDTKVVLGGPYANSNQEDIQGVDHFVLGEVEDTLHAFLSDLENGTAKHVYPLPARPDISKAPTPRFDLLKMDAYGSMAVQYSRGCPFHCEFCDIWTVYGNKPRLKSADAMIAEMYALYRQGWRGGVFLVDDNFIGNKKRVKEELLPALKAWQAEHGHPFHFFTEASINMAEDEDLLIGMREAGFNEVFIGIETPDEEGLKETGKVQNLKTDMGQAVKRIQKHGIEVMAGFIVGFDQDKPDIFERQIHFIQQNAIPKAMIGLLTALPGTRLYERLKSEGRMIGASIGNNTHVLSTNFKTVMDGERIKEGYKKILANIYDYRLKMYFERCNRFFDNMQYTGYFQRKIRYEEVKIFLKSLGRQPFTPYGWEYIKFLTRNFFKHREIFGEAVSMSITGHHFHTITQETLKKEKIASILEENYRDFVQLVNRYSKSLMTNSIDNIDYAAKLWKKRVKLLKEMQHKINKIHVDFRADLNNRYMEISKQMRELMNSFEQKALPAPE
ncbi:MAG TPA: radical SAM protein [Desulfosalsimonadaceae bacterium]|nr:radical SAM protein [Desulfosalsimonadaceae bacterium]